MLLSSDDHLISIYTTAISFTDKFESLLNSVIIQDLIFMHCRLWFLVKQEVIIL